MKSSEIASRVDGELKGDPDLEIDSIASIDSVSSNRLSFLTTIDPEFDLSLIPEDACLLVPLDFPSEHDFTEIRVEDPKLSFAKAASLLIQEARPTGIHDSASIAQSAQVNAAFVGANVSIGENSRIGSGAIIHPGVTIGEDVSVGEDCRLFANVSVYDHSEIGSGCVLHAGAVIGAPGFGYVREKDELIGFPQIGRVVLGERVEIGANTCIDRGALGDTVIGSDTKIDNLVQVAHNVQIGERVIIAAHVGISGSVVIEDDVVIGGQVGIADHVTVKKGAVLGARSAVFPGKIVRAGIWAGTPIQSIEKYKEQNAHIRSLARLKEEIKELRKKLK